MLVILACDAQRASLVVGTLCATRAIASHVRITSMIRQLTSAYASVSIRQHTSAQHSIRVVNVTKHVGKLERVINCDLSVRKIGKNRSHITKIGVSYIYPTVLPALSVLIKRP